MSNVALWQSHCHANNKLVTFLCIPILFLLVGFCFAMHFLGFGAVAIVLLVLLVASLVSIIVVGRMQRWNNPHLVFSLTDDKLYCSHDTNANFLFWDEYTNIERCSYKECKNGYITAEIWFKTPSFAGSLGKLKSLKMVWIENKDLMISVLESHGIPCENITDKKKQL